MSPLFWGFMAEPAQNVLNGLHPRLGKLVEIGTIYTTVAGLLNILAIYDAFEGPAYLEAENAGRCRVPISVSVGFAGKRSRREDPHDHGSLERLLAGSSPGGRDQPGLLAPRGTSHGRESGSTRCGSASGSSAS